MHRKPSEIARVLYECNGLIVNAAKKLLVDTRTVHEAIKRHPIVREAREAGLREIVGIAENNLVELLIEKDKAATFFVLKSLGRETWGEKETETVDKEEPIELVDDE